MKGLEMMRVMRERMNREINQDIILQIYKIQYIIRGNMMFYVFDEN